MGASNLLLVKATTLFLKSRSFGETQNITPKLFQWWGIKEYYKRINLSNIEVAGFYDYLLKLIEEAYLLYYGGKTFYNVMEDSQND